MDDLSLVTFIISTLFFIMWVCVTIWEVPVLKKLSIAINALEKAIQR